MRRAIIDDPSRIGWGRDPLEVVRAYLPLRYEARMEGTAIVIEGDDYAGWTMDDYVIPRLASGMIYARVEEPATSRVVTEAVRFADEADPNRESQEWSRLADDEWDYYNDDDQGE